MRLQNLYKNRHLRLLSAFRFCALTLITILIGHSANAQEGLYDIQSFNLKYAFNYQEAPDQLLAVNAAANTGATGFKWQKFTTAGGGPQYISGATAATYTPPTLTATTWYRRETIKSGVSYFSNTIKYELVSTNWEDVNYTRQHTVLKANKTTWQTVDQLAIGDKLVSTTYYDGLGRPIQSNAKGVALQDNGTTWGDIVSYAEYDKLGRSPENNLPYSSITNIGKYKANVGTEQAAYYNKPIYNNDGTPFSVVAYEASPLNRVTVAKAPGAPWNAATGDKALYLTNSATEDVKRFTIDIAENAMPVLSVSNPVFGDNTLYKTVTFDADNTVTDADNKSTITYYNDNGLMVLKKVKLATTPTVNYGNDWICTYYVYDDMGQLRCEIQPEGVKWLSANGWSFSAANGTTVFNEQCFIYAYDDKGRTIYKKSPGAEHLRMLYDSRDRIVFMQDGNQRLKSPPEWTANLYDELDRIVLTTLYRSSATTATLQTAINGAADATAATITNPGGTIEDLEVNTHTANRTQYTATKTVTLADGFETSGSLDIIIEITPGAVTAPVAVPATVHKSPLSAAELTGANCTILKYFFYDNYSFAGAKTFDAAAATAAAAYPASADVLPIAATARVTSMPTGSLTRVLGTTTFLATSTYYDEDGNPIQSIDQNIKLGYDVATSQYGWDGRVLATHSRHNMPGGDLNNYGIRTKYIFDIIGRVTSTEKTFGTNAARTMAAYKYDDLGRIKTKTLDPSYVHPVAGMGPSGGGLETIDYSYNIQGTLTGLNKDYALKAVATYEKWRHFFGTYLGYENNGGALTSTLLTGQMAGQVWNTMGDDAQRKFEYTYDNVGRLSNAVFNERQTTATAWANTKLDFASTHTYDLNGNLLTMTQRGFLIGKPIPVTTIDNLAYTYNSFSNKLLRVKDNVTGDASTGNGVNGDFKDGVNGVDANDYVYDANGNLVVDLNKNIKDLAGTYGIKYNHLDKPEEIKIVGKGTVKIVYDADGSKLRRTFTAETGGATKTTTYINEYVYEETNTTPIAAQFISFEEGRIRPVTPRNDNNGLDAFYLAGNLTLPNGKQGSIDYYITDQRHDTRMILTEETQYSYATASMETANGRGTTEQGLFGQTGANNEVLKTRAPKSDAPGWVSNTTAFVSKLNSTNKTGPNQLLKVMAGDLLSTTVKYYYQSPVTNSATSTVFTDVLSMLAGSIVNSPATSATTKGATTGINNVLNTGTPFSQIISPDITSAAGDKPKAYLNIVFFDERFNFVQEASTSQRVSQAGDNAPPLGLLNIKAPKNGYCLVYISNESSQNVFFDNLQVRHDRERIIEENHYYAYGLKIAAISSKAYGAPNNNFLYQGDFSEFDDDLGWNDFELRSYDAQIGRFLQNDPYDQFASGYVGMGNDPANGIDPSGGGAETLAKAATTAMDASNNYNAVVTFSRLLTTTSGTGGSLLGAISLGGTITSTAARTAAQVEVTTLINSAFAVEEVAAGAAVLEGVSAGAAGGSVVPVVGTVIGAVVVGGLTYLVATTPPSREPSPLPQSYFNKLGDIQTLPGTLPSPKYEPKPRPEPLPPAPDPKPRPKIFYATYTKTARDGSVYSGRTSGTYSGDAPTKKEAEAAVDARESGHHIKGYGRAVLDKFSTSKGAIQGREQQLIDYHGGARNEGGRSGNQIRGVSRFNPLRWVYDQLSSLKWRRLRNNNPIDNVRQSQ